VNKYVVFFLQILSYYVIAVIEAAAAAVAKLFILELGVTRVHPWSELGVGSSSVEICGV